MVMACQRSTIHYRSSTCST